MPSQYYYANPEMTDIHGPFFSKDLVVLAHSGVLRRDYYVSKDQETWFPATKVNGLIFPPEEAESERTAVDVLADADVVNSSLSAFMEENLESAGENETADDGDIEQWLEFPELNATDDYVPFAPKSRPPIERPVVSVESKKPRKPKQPRKEENTGEESDGNKPNAPPPLPSATKWDKPLEITDFRRPGVDETVMWEGDGCFVTTERFHFSGRDDSQQRGERSETTVLLRHVSIFQTCDVCWTPNWPGAFIGLIGVVSMSTSGRLLSWYPRGLGVTGGIVLLIAVCLFRKNTGLVIEYGTRKFFEFSQSHHARSVANTITGVTAGSSH
tara:strand:+ start:58 stop:1041 length:984 start_codon:yes stop_codon:yes gene_type:complete